MTALNAAIIGAGLAGLCTARALLRRGAEVTLFDRSAPGRGASWAAAGMLAPTFETATAGLDHPGMFELLFEARAFWRQWTEAPDGVPAEVVGYRDDPLIALATTPGEAAAYERLMKFDRARPLTDAEQSDVLGRTAGEGLPAFALPLDGQVDNRALITWLLDEVKRLGGQIERQEVTDHGMAPDTLGYDVMVDARGWRIPGMTPVKGTAMSLQPHPGLPGRLVRWGRNYLVPKAGRVILGAHAMPGLADTTIDEAIIEELRAEAAEVFPAVLEAKILETWSGVRPRLRDGAPAIGWMGERTYMAGGYYRDGVLLAPLLGDRAAADICGEPVPAEMAALQPTRFSAAIS